MLTSPCCTARRVMPCSLMAVNISGNRVMTPRRNMPESEIRIPFNAHAPLCQIDLHNAVVGVRQQAFTLVQAAGTGPYHQNVVGSRFEQMVHLAQQLLLLVDHLKTYKLMPV